MNKKINLKQFISRRDGLDGGIGCVEPYCESVLQVYIQTAIFSFVRNIDPILTRLCYTENNQTCMEYDNCGDPFQCDIGGMELYDNCDRVGDEPYIGGYHVYEKILNCRNTRENCTTKFENCMGPFRKCIEDCKSNLTKTLFDLDADQLYNAVYTTNLSLFLEHPLVQEYDAKKEDLQSLQMYLLVIGNYGLFISTYLISIIAAAYGVTKFFRLGHARLVTSMKSSGFICIFILSTGFMVLKGIVLGGIIVGSRTPITESMLWWLLFSMLPTTVLVLIISLVLPCYKMQKKFQKIPWSYLINMIVKQPAILLAPHITPFVFTMKKIYIVDKIKARDVDGKKQKTLSCYGSYGWTERFSFLNVLITMTGCVALLSWKAPWITEGWKIFASAIGILILGMIIYLFERDIKKSQECPEHHLMDCYDCIEVYGFFVENFEEVEVCEFHEDVEPFEYTRSTSDCDKCERINKR